MTVCREHLTFKQNPLQLFFLPTLSNAKMENMQTAVAVKEVWLLCVNSWARQRVSAPSVSAMPLTSTALLFFSHQSSGSDLQQAC